MAGHKPTDLVSINNSKEWVVAREIKKNKTTVVRQCVWGEFKTQQNRIIEKKRSLEQKLVNRTANIRDLSQTSNKREHIKNRLLSDDVWDF